MELDTWQKKLTQLLSDALKRYFEINAATKKYSIFVNSLTEKVGNIDIFLQRLEVSEKKCDDLTAGGELLRFDMLTTVLFALYMSN
jgi:DNA repair ATPase RecN